MIKNERQYIIRKGQIRKFKTALEQFDNEKTDTDVFLSMLGFISRFVIF